jgi:hypothetical protein
VGDFQSPAFALLLHLNVFTALSLFRVRGTRPNFRIPPNIATHHVSAEEQLTMPPQKKSKKNVPAETSREDHHPPQGNEISFVPEPSNTTDQERRAKLEALMKARAEKTAHTQEQPAEWQTFENVDDDVDTIDREAKNTAAAKRQGKIRESVASKKKNL